MTSRGCFFGDFLIVLKTAKSAFDVFFEFGFGRFFSCEKQNVKSESCKLVSGIVNLVISG